MLTGWRFWVLALLVVSGSVFGQNIGDVTAIDLTAGQTSLTLDFTDRDFELILYSSLTETGGTNRAFSYRVSGQVALGETATAQSQSSPAVTVRERLESVLRAEEAIAAARRMELGGKSAGTPVRKAIVGNAPRSVRTFAFNAFGDLTEDETVEAVLVASSSRAVAYLDTAMVDSSPIRTADFQAMLDSFSDSAYPTVTGVFGEPSDVDSDGKVLFLFTPLVDQVGGIRGFYRSRSLFSRIDGGDGNHADMIYISPTQPLKSYKPLLAHEFQHLVNFNQHVLLRKGLSEESWLNEALSQVTEDLVDGYLEGDNPDLVRTYLSAPEEYALTGAAGFSKGIRGAGYLFLRGVLDDFGEETLSKLVQTVKTGGANVEAVTKQKYQDLYARFAARMFLSGTGLGNGFNYQFPFFTESAGGQRTLPPPRESLVVLPGGSAEGVVRPAAMVFLRLTGDSPQEQILIETETVGAFRALLIPVPRGFKPRLALGVDYFPGLTFAAPLQVSFSSGESTRMSGTVSDRSISQLYFRFRRTDGANAGTEVDFAFDVRDGRFARSVMFDPSHAGEYELLILSSRTGGQDSVLGKFAPVNVSSGRALAQFPVDFFPGVTLDAPLPAAVSTGERIRISGAVTDPSVSEIVFSFRALEGGGDNADFSFDVNGGHFGRGIVFNALQSGTYELRLMRGVNGGLPVEVDRFSPVTVTQGSDPIAIPVDYFPGVILDAPLPSEFSTGEAVRISGTVSDAWISRILLRLRSHAVGGEDLEFTFDVTDGRFNRSIIFNSSQVGSYDLTLFKGINGEALPFAGAFSPITIRLGTSIVSVPVDFFPGVVLDAPMPTFLRAGEGVRVSGAIADASVSNLLFRFRPIDGNGQEVDFVFEVSEGRFGRSIVFNLQQTGNFEWRVFEGRVDEPLSFNGAYSTIAVGKGSDVVRIPVDFFPGLILDTPLPSVLTSGKGIRISGVVTDPSLSQLMFRFQPLDGMGRNADFFFDVSDGRFGRSILFYPSQVGDHKLILFEGRKGESLPYVGGFSPITISEGDGEIRIPVDFFTGVTLDATLPATYAAGEAVRFSGRISDLSVTQALFSFERLDAVDESPVRFFAAVVEGRFDHAIGFDPSQAGNYELLLFLGKAGEPLPFSGRLSLVTVTPPNAPTMSGPVFLDGGGFEFKVICQPAIRVIVEVSENLREWTQWLEEIVPAEGELTIRDTLGERLDQRFYRVRVP